jgi:hypothetical protein
MLKLSEHGPLTEKILHLLDEGQGREQITNDLLDDGYDEEIVHELVKETIKLRHSKRMSQGLTLILIGAVICFSSFLLTITSSFSSGSFPIVLYGLTSAGILVVFAGFTKVF